MLFGSASESTTTRPERSINVIRALAAFDSLFKRIAGLDLPDHLQLGGDTDHVSGADCVSVACGSRERRKVAVGNDILRQHTACGFQKLRRLRP